MQIGLFDQELLTRFPPLRPFQKTAHESLRAGARDGHKNQMVCAPTGSGKTLLALNVIYQALLRGKRCIFLCDRKTLINQTCEVANELGLTEYGVIQAEHPRFDSSQLFQIASAQTIAKRGWPDDVDVIVIDESHTTYKVWTEHIVDCKAKVIGLSATPFTKGLAKLFTNLINAATMHELTQQGILVPMRVFSCTKVNMQGAKTVAGEWSAKDAGIRGTEIIGDVVSEWIRYGENRKTIVFGATIAHCEEMCRKFNEAGIPAATFTQDTKDEERQKLLAEYRKPNSTLRILLSVEALAKGFDVRDVGCVCDVRPLQKSLSAAIQMWGRGLRSSPETGKKDCRLLDFSGNIVRFADDFSEFFYDGIESLDAGRKLDKTIRKDEDKPERACPSCGARPFGKRCIACGYEHVKKSMVEHEAGAMREITLGGKKLANDHRDLYNQLVNYARETSKPEKQRGRAANLYREITGEWPPRNFDFDAAPHTRVTLNTARKIQSLRIAFVRANKKRPT